MTQTPEKMHTLYLSDEFVQRIQVGLLEIQAKFAIPVINSINQQIADASGVTQIAAGKTE